MVYDAAGPHFFSAHPNPKPWVPAILSLLKRLYASPAMAEHMTWHACHQTEEGSMCHPYDAEAWRHFDQSYPDFAMESRNVRLALCTDGFAPHGQYERTYSCWPIIFTPYNLPSEMCMKPEYMFLTMVIPRPSNPKHRIDVYLEPLIEELLQLWHIGNEPFVTIILYHGGSIIHSLNLEYVGGIKKDNGAGDDDDGVSEGEGDDESDRLFDYGLEESDWEGDDSEIDSNVNGCGGDGVTDGDTYTFISDKKKGLIPAFECVFPWEDNRVYVRYYPGNMKTAGYGGIAFKKWVVECCKCNNNE
ncbi:UNVERIFIED_CONTAM: hypothetical protein Scaly_2713800 [Sesamum calycinum]|uniref:Uncharacterized protein n=1 Tax=Sesamum calycinum TaxID=2727403 RepID=A0AAW2J3K8_9LAMI